MPVSTESSLGSTASADTAAGTVVELVDARKKFGSVEALRGVSLAVRPGELVGLLGPNGAGKTTAISLMLGLRQPSSGKALLFGLEPRDLRARSRIGVMLQESGIPLTLRVREVVDLFRTYYPKPLPTDQVIEMADLGDFQDKLVKNLSGGQHQRVYFALAICGDPDALFLDEPTVGLDTATRRSFWEQVRGFKRRGKSIVLTTHYLDEADALADRVIVIDHGLIVAEDSPEAIRGLVPGKKVAFSWPGVTEAALAELPVESLVVDGSRVSFLTSSAEDVLRNLFAKGAPLTDLEVVGAGLEEAVLVLTGGR
ncbi:MAG: ABC transporter ATP-binding protein [Candidatus Dormibacteraeota bacterium]|nr:ABC transporter ATP-binding protein [Candidatus Dormibacteraeota bacterium]